VRKTSVWVILIVIVINFCNKSLHLNRNPLTSCRVTRIRDNINRTVFKIKTGRWLMSKKLYLHMLNRSSSLSLWRHFFYLSPSTCQIDII
jgi:hypothetical protein